MTNLRDFTAGINAEIQSIRTELQQWKDTHELSKNVIAIQRAEIDRLLALVPTTTKPATASFAIAERLLKECLKPEEISGPKREIRMNELLHWFNRFADQEANGKWLYGHAFELAYYIATLPLYQKEQKEHKDVDQG